MVVDTVLAEALTVVEDPVGAVDHLEDFLEVASAEGQEDLAEALDMEVLTWDQDLVCHHLLTGIIVIIMVGVVVLECYFGFL